METIKGTKLAESYDTQDKLNSACMTIGIHEHRVAWWDQDGNFVGQHNGGPKEAWHYAQKKAGGAFHAATRNDATGEFTFTGTSFVDVDEMPRPVTEHGGELAQQEDVLYHGPVAVASLADADKFFLGVNQNAYRDKLAGDPWYTLLAGRNSEIKAAINFASYEYNNWPERGQHTYTGPLLSHVEAVLGSDTIRII